jgi:hemoglobin-like flavoprotein
MAATRPSPPADFITTVEDTWAIVKKIDGVAEHFYNTLFELRPEYRTTLFRKAKINIQAVMLTSMLDTAVRYIRQPEILIPNLRDIGLRHCRYGCRAEDYALGRQAFLSTLSHFCGAGFTPDVAAAWGWTYDVVATVMVNTADTTEGRRLLAEYDAKEKGIPMPKEFASPSSPTDTVLRSPLFWGSLAATAAVAAVAGRFVLG